MEAAIDLHQCKLEKMTLQHLLDFIKQLVAIAGMKEQGDPVVWDASGSDELHIKGYSILQFIQTSSIVMHTMDKTNLICLNLFSCKPFDVDVVISFAQKFFDTVKTQVTVINRGLSQIE
jgi:S-adenosylmethionine/arginine decarboxylase-like enzyme